jgi:hypothetical protein
MFTEQELRENGAKKAVLDYIASQDKSIPLPETVPGEEVETGTILRSDSWREFDSFYGIFDSILISNRNKRPSVVSIGEADSAERARKVIFFEETGEEELDRHVTLSKRDFERYCEAKGLKPEEVLSELRILPQRFIHSRFNGTIFLHPNVPNRYLFYAGGSAAVIDSDQGQITSIRPDDPEFPNLSFSPATLERILKLYKKVSVLPKFQDGYSYMVEFTAEPDCVLQARRFRKIEDGSRVKCKEADWQGALKTDLCFGVTPPNGIVLPYFDGCLAFGDVIKEDPSSAQVAELREFFGYRDISEINNAHPEGFAYPLTDHDSYAGTMLSNLRGALCGSFSHYCHHGGFENMLTIPVYLSNIHRTHGGLCDTEDRKIPLQCGTQIRVFSNGQVGYVKLES